MYPVEQSPSTDILEFGMALTAARPRLERAARLHTTDRRLQLQLINGALQAAWRARERLARRRDIGPWLEANLAGKRLH